MTSTGGDGTTMAKVWRRALVVAAIGFAAAGCAADDAGAPSSTTAPVATSAPAADAGSFPEACAAIEEIDRTEFGTDIELLRRLTSEARDTGPEELQDDWDTFVAVFEVMYALDPEAPDFLEQFERVTQMGEDPAFLASAAAIDDFAEETCGLDVQIDPEEASTGGSGSGSGSSGSGGTFVDRGEGDAPSTVTGVHQALRSRFGTESWYEDGVANGMSLTFDYVGEVAEWTVTFDGDPSAAGMSQADLLGICDAMATYLDGAEVVEDVEITIEGPRGTAIAERAPGGPCVGV